MAEVLEAPAVDDQQDDGGFRPAKPATADSGGFRAAAPTASNVVIPPPVTDQSIAEANAPMAVPSAAPEKPAGQYVVGTPKGLLTQGNINILDRPIVPNPDEGGSSTVYSMGIEADGKHILIPRVSDGKDGKPPHIMSEPEAKAYYRKTGEHLGMFDSDDAADAYGSQVLHQQQATLGNRNGRTYPQTPGPFRPAGLPAGVDLPGLPGPEPATVKGDWLTQDAIDNPPPTTAGGIVKRAVLNAPGVKPVISAAKFGAGAADKVLSGISDIAAPTPAETRGISNDVGGIGGYRPSMSADEQSTVNRKAVGGLAKILAGGGEVGLIIGAPELAGLGTAAAAGDTTAIAALARIGASVGVGAGASYGVGKAADKLHLSPEAKELAQQAAFWTAAGLTGYAAKIEPTKGDFGTKGVKASIPGASADVGFRPAYRQPAPEGGYGEGSSVVPGRVTAGVTVAGRRFVTGPEVRATAEVPPAPEPKLLEPVEGSKPVQQGPPAVPPEVTPDGRVAGEATAQHPNMAPAMEQATNAHQPVGTEEPQTGRPIVQPTDNPAINQALATSHMPEFEAGITKAIAGIPGANLAASRAEKNPERLAEKINGEGKPASTVGDYGAVQISVDSPEARDATVAAIKKAYPVVVEDDKFEKGDKDYGYRNHSLQVQTPTGGTMEVQIVPKEVMEANPDEHGNYKTAREAKIAGNDAEFAKQAADAKKKNDAAMEAFNTRNEVGEKENSAETGGRGESPEQPAAGGAKALPAPARSRSYDDVQKDIDRKEDELEATGGDVFKQFRSRQPGNEILAQDGWKAMPSDLEDLYEERDAIGSGQLQESIAEITRGLKTAGITKESEIRRALDSYALDARQTDATKQYMAAQHTQKATERPLADQVADMYSALAADRGIFMDDRDDLYRDRQTTIDAAKAVKAIVSYFRGEPVNVDKFLPKEAPAKIEKGSAVTLSDGTAGTVAWSMGGKARVKTADGSRRDVPVKELQGGHVDTEPIGKPLSKRVAQIKDLIAKGTDVRIFSARVADDPQDTARAEIEAWSEKNLGKKLPITDAKDDNEAWILDDHANVVPNVDTPFDIPPIPKGKWLGVDLDRTIAAEGKPNAEAPQELSGVRQPEATAKGEEKPADAAKPAVQPSGEPVAGVGTVKPGEVDAENPEAGFLNIGDLRDMAAPLREELARRGEIADVAGDVQSTFQRLDRTNKAATLEAKGIARAFQDAGFTKADGDKVFAHLEDPSVKLTPQQVELRDKWIKPLDKRAATQRRIALLIKSGKFPIEDILAGKVPKDEVDRIAPEQENYQHRIAVDKNTFVDKILGDSMKRFRAPGGALSRAFSSSKRSVFQEIRGTDGQREAVAVKNGRVTQFVPSSTGKPTLVDLGPYRSGFIDTQAIADEATAPLEKKVAALKKERSILTETKGRQETASRRLANIEKELASLGMQIDAIQQSIGNAPAKMTDDEALAARLAPIHKVMERQAKQKADLKATPANAKKIARLTRLIQENQGIIDSIREEHDGLDLSGRYWRDKDGNLWKFDRGTTKFITERTGQKYHANAMLSSLVNYMETNKAMNAAIVMERTKGLLEDQGMALKTDNPSTVPDGWKPTTLLQMHNYYFPAHIADALDQFDYLQSRGQPNVLERANRFIIQSVLMNPLMHGKNIAANYFTGKAAEAITGSAFRPKWYGNNMEAGVKAVNTLKDLGGPEYRRLLRLGLDLQGADSSFDNTTKDILRSFTDELAKDKESNAAMSALIGVADAAKWLQHMNHLATFGINDLFLLQSFYAKEAELQAQGIANPSEGARDWAHQQVAEYTTPVRVAGSAAVGRLLENPNLSAFWRYHFGGILRPVINAVKETAGSFKPDEDATGTGKERNAKGQTRAEARTNAVGRLAVLTLFATVIYPKVLDKLAKKMTGDEQAKAPRGGTMGFASNVAETVEGERSVASLAGSVFTPALGTEELAEIGINRDFFTGRHIMGTNVGFEDNVKQLGAWLTSKSTPGQITHRFDQSKGKQALWGLLGFTFPMEHGLKEAAEIRSEASGSNPSDPQKSKVFQSILAAAEQAHRSGGKDTRVKDALLKTGKLTPSQRKELMDAVRESPIVFAVSGLEQPEDVWRVYQHSTDEEKSSLAHDPHTRSRLYKYETKLRHDGDNKKADAIGEALK